ncbi:MAG: adenylate/guanylate cyclase domain-containing protein [Campylobacterota bacterium]|nr:adenylate/guanylate cyclase domain-containing protein [Campylobacterota bacterium]
MKEKLLYLLAISIVVLVSLLLQLNRVEPFESFSLRFNDINFELQEKDPNKNILFVAVDEPSVNEYGRWPWNREILAQGIDKLAQADVVLMDMIFSEPTSQKSDLILGESLSNLNASVCGFFLRHTSTQVMDEEELDILGDSSLDLLQSQVAQNNMPKFASAPYAEINILPILESCSLSGSFSTVRASDDKLREYPISMYFNDTLYPSLAIQGLRLKFDKDITRVDEKRVELNSHEMTLNRDGLVRLNFYKQEQYEIISFLDVMQGKVSAEYFKNKIVILGITEVGAGDIVSSPIGAIPGPLLHYTFLSNLLEGHLIVEPEVVSTLIMLFSIFLPFILVFFIKSIRLRTFINISVYILIYLTVRYLFVSQMLYIDLFYPLLGLLLSIASIEAVAFTQQENSSRFMRGAFSSYLSEDLLDQLIKNPKALSLGGEKKELSVLFSDIRGFTSISESMDAQSLVRLLNRYFTPMTNAVLEHKGMLDKYIGDAVMAFYNAPVDVENHADEACQSALEMIERLDSLNEELKKEGIPPIHIGIGINTAGVVVGNIGANTRFNYTVMGDGVNLASRVEGLTKNYGVDILITEFTFNSIKSDFITREIEPVKVKGKDEAVLLYELMPTCEESRVVKKLYDKALSIYKSGDFAQAQTLFVELVEVYKDTPSAYFLKNIKESKQWGVHKMDTK